VPPAPAPVPVAPPASTSAPLRVYSADDGNVVPPSIVNQPLPMFPGQLHKSRAGTLKVVIGETGAVESAAITGFLSAAYEHLVLTATKTWRFTPATIDGTPVKFKKVVQIVLGPTT
jgi:hypothetical protein